jgi:hypothetical protein
MMKNFMASGSLTLGLEDDKGDTMTILGEDMVMMIYDGRPLPRMHHVSNPSLGTPVHYGWGAVTQGCRDMIFPICLYINVCRNRDMYIIDMPKAKIKCDIPTQGLIGLIEYSYHQGLSMLGPGQF